MLTIITKHVLECRARDVLRQGIVVPTKITSDNTALYCQARSISGLIQIEPGLSVSSVVGNAGIEGPRLSRAVDQLTQKIKRPAGKTLLS